MIFASIGIYALSRSAEPGQEHPKNWLVLAVFVFVFSILSYEVALGLITASICWIGWHVYSGKSGPWRRHTASLKGIAATAAVLAAVWVVKMMMQSRFVYHHRFFRALAYLGQIIPNTAVQSVRFNLWAYGLHMPVVLASLYKHSALGRGAAGTAVVLSGLVAMYLWRRFSLPMQAFSSGMDWIFKA